ncbi:hypothetical protein BKA56DRAFT_661346 [Ilyonectria sp. MPI-CAGE-AT-0026]|nr:hypothetical protein BKA56DRAFT_661346 [Ilyonectria sp. MPI-CAGE-AT-0026]
MHLTSILLASVVGLAAAGNPGGTYTTKSCVTTLGTKSVRPVPTATSTHKKTYTVRRTTTIQNTVTIKPRDATDTVTSTTVVTVDEAGPTATDVVEVVATEYSTSTVTADTTTFTETSSTSTSTTSTSTYTAPTPAGYIPIQSSLPGSSMKGLTGIPSGSTVTKRDEAASPGFTEGKPCSGPLAARQIPKNGVCPLSGDKKGQYQQKYAQKVQCDVTTYVPTTLVVTKTKPALTTTLSTSTKLVTAMTTLTSTNTVYPPDVTVETTSTSTSVIEETETPSTTVTVTSTTTNTVTATATNYAVCDDSANYADSKNNDYGLTFPQIVSLRTVVYAAATSAWQCCNNCVADSTCVTPIYAGGSTCCLYRVTDGTCPVGSPCSGTLRYVPGSASALATYMNTGRVTFTGYTS